MTQLKEEMWHEFEDGETEAPKGPQCQDANPARPAFEIDTPAYKGPDRRKASGTPHNRSNGVFVRKTDHDDAEKLRETLRIVNEKAAQMSHALKYYETQAQKGLLANPPPFVYRLRSRGGWQDGGYRP